MAAPGAGVRPPLPFGRMIPILASFAPASEQRHVSKSPHHGTQSGMEKQAGKAEQSISAYERRRRWVSNATEAYFGYARRTSTPFTSFRPRAAAPARPLVGRETSLTTTSSNSCWTLSTITVMLRVLCGTARSAADGIVDEARAPIDQNFDMSLTPSGTRQAGLLTADT